MACTEGSRQLMIRCSAPYPSGLVYVTAWQSVPFLCLVRPLPRVRILAIVLYVLAALFGVVAVFLGYGSVAVSAAYLLLFGLAFARIAALQTSLGPPRADDSSQSPLAIFLFAAAVLGVVAAFLLSLPGIAGVAVVIALFGVLFHGLSRLAATLRRVTDDSRHTHTKP